MQEPYFASRPGSAKQQDMSDVSGALTRCGENTGNLLFFAASRRAIRHTIPSSSVKFDPRTVGDRHDGIIIPAANWLRPTSDFGGLADIIEASKLPAVVLGLGAQSFDGAVPALTPGTLRFLKVVSERSKSISVRGPFSGEVLEYYGIRNYDVTGCPSLLWHVSRPARIDRLNQSIKSVSIGATRSDSDKALFTNPAFSIGLYMSRLAYRRRLDYVCQSELSDMMVAMDAFRTESERQLALNFLGRVFDTTDLGKLKRYLEGRSKTFFDVDDWVKYAAGIDLTISTRLHGVIAALLAGRPAILITHDSRTKEMADHAGIPSIDQQEILQSPEIDFEKLYKGIDIKRFNDRQVSYYDDFIKFFEKNEIKHNLNANWAFA